MMAVRMWDITQMDHNIAASRILRQPAKTFVKRPLEVRRKIFQHIGPVTTSSSPVRVLVWNGRRQQHHQRLRSWGCHYKLSLSQALQTSGSWPAAAMATKRYVLDLRRREYRHPQFRASASSVVKSSVRAWVQARRLFSYLLLRCVPGGAGRDIGDGAMVVVQSGSTVVVTLSILSWIVLPKVLRRLYLYMETAPTPTTKRLEKVVGRTPLEKVLEKVPYKLSMCGALEDPAHLLAAIVAFSHLAYTVAPTSVAAVYVTQIWSGATVVCMVWFLYRWKTNLFARIVTEKSFAGPDKQRYLTMDHLSSLGLLILGCMAVAEACGMAVQSILTVGGIGGVATAFAAKDVMGNMLCGVALQFSKPFSVGDSIAVQFIDLSQKAPHLHAGPVSGQVVEMGMHSTQLLNADKFPIIVPNSFFSSQVIVNKSRVQWRGLAFTLPIRLQDLERVPTITAEVRKMLTEHPKVYLETEMPRCHVIRVGGLSLELNVACNLKPMGTDEFLMTEEALLIEAAEIVVKSGALLGSDKTSCSLSGDFQL